MRYSVLTCSIILPCTIKIFITVAELCSLNENEIQIWIRGHNYLKKKDKQSCMRHSVLTCSIILPNIIEIFLMVTELCSGNENEERIWIRGHNYLKKKISRVVCDTRVDLFYNPTKYH